MKKKSKPVGNWHLVKARLVLVVGDYNPAHSVASFDQLFRQNLINLYHLLKLPIPSSVLEPISKGGWAS